MRPPQSRVERRTLQRTLRESYRSLRRTGLGLPVSLTQLLSLSLFAKDCLEQRGGSPDMAELFSVFDAGHDDAQKNMPIACRKGCNFCCHIAVSATIVEIDVIARHVKSTWSVAAIEALVARIETTFRMNVDDRLANRAPCPFLVEGSCSIYAVRPFACRRQVSIDASLCEKALDGGDANFPFIKSVGQHGANVRVATAAAAKACGIDYTAYELTSAMRKFLKGAIDIRRFDRRKDFGNEVLADEMPSDLHRQVDIFVEFIK
jgi:Fe-S-cluster containining protein